jgi:ribosomal-protein-alanine N-acetyltransferase
MMKPMMTERLILRRFCDEDRAPFAALTADPEVMEYFPALLTQAESDALLDRINELIGFTGLVNTQFEAAFTPCVEVGWRLARAHWGQGFAYEAAKESLRFGFEELDLAEIVSFTVPKNVRSRHVMERLGMRHDEKGDFDHPKLPAGHPLQRHVLYRLAR